MDERRPVPLWTQDTPHDPMPRPLRRTAQSASRTAEPMDPHTERPQVASALPRRPHLWASAAR
ncbi:hypothetical protein [Streptomyces sp. NBC_01497]|uniref:hypothetical protein n=1 Tax=Streptomyces sp. NBC_01497 TaxID=2903885 RepID=UPI002E314B82|nr:hypothetical protein [Streptomyces sp. NBC_01497]